MTCIDPVLPVDRPAIARTVEADGSEQPVRLTGPQRGVLRCALAAVLFGATTPIASRLVGTTTAPVLAGLLYLGAGVASLGAMRRSSRVSPGPAARQRLLGAVITGGFLGPLLLAAGLARVPAATASLLLNLELVATTVLAAVFFGEHVGRRVATGTLLVLAAGVIAGWSDVPEFRWGAVLVVSACVCWGIDNCITATLDSVPPAQITLIKGFVAGAANLTLGLLLGGSLPSGADTFAALSVGALGYGLSITLWVSGARELGAARGQLVFSAAPFIGVLTAWFALGDSVRPAEAIGVALAVGGVAFVVGSGHLHTHRHELVQHEHEHEHNDDHHTHQHAEADPSRHSHAHRHEPLEHAHPHVPDLHHRHVH